MRYIYYIYVKYLFYVYTYVRTHIARRGKKIDRKHSIVFNVHRLNVLCTTTHCAVVKLCTGECTKQIYCHDSESKYLLHCWPMLSRLTLQVRVSIKYKNT